MSLPNFNDGMRMLEKFLEQSGVRTVGPRVFTEVDGSVCLSINVIALGEFNLKQVELMVLDQDWIAANEALPRCCFSFCTCDQSSHYIDDHPYHYKATAPVHSVH